MVLGILSHATYANDVPQTSWRCPFAVIAGSIDLSVGFTVALVALTAVGLSDTLGIFAVVPAVLVGLVAGMIKGTLVACGKVLSFILTLGAMVVFRGVALLFT